MQYASAVMDSANRRLAALAIVVAAGACVGGFLLDAEDFAGNLLGEVTGVVGGVLLALLVVDRLLDRDRDRRWQLVAQETHGTLRFAIVQASLLLYLQLPAPRKLKADPLSMHDAGELHSGLEELSRELLACTSATVPDGDPVALSRILSPQLALIRDSVMPRLIALDRDPELIEALARVESRAQTWLYTLWQEQRFGLPFSAVLTSAASIVDSFAEAIAVLDSRRKDV